MADLPIASDNGATECEIIQSSTLNKLAIAAVGSLQTLADNTGAGTIGALDGTIAAITRGCGAVSFNVTGTWVATLTIQATTDGTNWVTANGNISNIDTTVQTFATNQLVTVPCGSFSQVRLIATAYTSGTATVAWSAGAGGNVLQVFSPVAAAFNVTAVQGATAWTENLTQVGGSAIALGQTTMSASVPVNIASDQSTLVATLGNSTGKTVVMRTGNLVTTAVTADQVVLTRTVTTGKTFYLEYLEMSGRQTTPGGGTSVICGTISLELPSGTKVISASFIGGGATLTDKSLYTFSEPIPVTSTSVIRVVVTPASATSFTWFANFGGYEK